jgi:hypothetical protein
VDWVHLAQDGDQWRGISWPAERILASQEGLCSVESVKTMKVANKRFWHIA